MAGFSSAFNPAFNFAFRNPQKQVDYVTIDYERFQIRLGPFNRAFDRSFDRGGHYRPWKAPFDHAFGPKQKWEVLRFWGFMDDQPRPRHPLWRKFHYPHTPMGVLLWKPRHNHPGRVHVVSSFHTDDFLKADDYILGGHLWFTEKDSWQAEAMEAAGFPLIPFFPLLPNVLEFPDE